MGIVLVPAYAGTRMEGWVGRATTRSTFHKSDLSENWGFWIPASAGMTDLGAIFDTLARETVENRLGMLSINHGRELMKQAPRVAPTGSCGGGVGWGTLTANVWRRDMKIAVMGSGGVGGYFGGMLAKAGNPVTFIARGEHLQAIQSKGLRVVHNAGEFTVDAAATDNPEDVGLVDLVMFCVKAYDTESALEIISSLVGPETMVLTLQNGVNSHEAVGRMFGEGHALPGAAYVESRIDSLGVVVQTGGVARLVFGEASGVETDRVRRVREALLSAGINAEVSPDVLATLWTKFLFIAAVAGLTSACRRRIGDLLGKPGYRKILVAAMREIEAVGRAKGINLDNAVVEQTMEYVEGAVKDITASMHLDLERGRRLELEIFNGAVVRMGQETGVATPVNDMLYLVLKPHVDGAGG